MCRAREAGECISRLPPVGLLAGPSVANRNLRLVARGSSCSVAEMIVEGDIRPAVEEADSRYSIDCSWCGHMFADFGLWQALFHNHVLHYCYSLDCTSVAARSTAVVHGGPADRWDKVVYYNLGEGKIGFGS